MWAQGNRCFFCDRPLPRDDASVEHLWAKANGGANADENCVACCKAVNALLGSMSLKEKFKVVLNQRGQFNCPNEKAAELGASENGKKALSEQVRRDYYRLVVDNLKQRGKSAPKTLKTLTSTIGTLLPKSHKGTSAHQLIEEMKATGFVAVAENKVAYDFSRSNVDI
jgi:hypothetical protein